MSLQLGDTAPNFDADTTEGRINFHDWLGDSWGILFSHPADFTPVCTTELGEYEHRRSDFEKRNVKFLAISVDSVDDHNEWKRMSARPGVRTSVSRSLATRIATFRIFTR